MYHGSCVSRPESSEPSAVSRPKERPGVGSDGTCRASPRSLGPPSI